MAGVSDCFSIGSTVACKTCYNKEIEGEVLAFDPQTKMLILSILLVKNFYIILTNHMSTENRLAVPSTLPDRVIFVECPASNGRPSLNDVHIVNLSLVSDVQVKREVSPTTSEPPQSLNLQMLNRRVRNQIEEKKRLVMALQAGVSPEGQKLFIAISKTIQDITWNGANIVVFDNVTIRPPYKVDNVHGNEDSGAYKHVKKVVEKHIKDTAASAQVQQQREQQQQPQKGSAMQ
ncbi:protein LSM12 [Vespula maculifrons]|uniref:Protein LSM12 n=1 Tax=Vespula maculifrons TaxID=7453 RepID=A0ABD2CZB4_VESMC